MNPELLRKVQRYLALAAITPASLRHQGSPGVVGAAQLFLSNIDLAPFAVPSQAGFLQALDAATLSLRQATPKAGRSWGGARKAINLFLRDALYNSYLRQHYDLAKSEAYLELPLDAYVAAGLRRRSPRASLPRWAGVKALSPGDSSRFQQRAAEIAAAAGIARIHLDLELWIEGRSG